MNLPTTLKYTESHEWLRKDPDGTVVVGITDHAQEALGDVVFLELPEVGRTLAAREECAVIESVKAASDIYAPIAGTVVAVNAEAVEHPETINGDPYGVWLFKLQPANADDTATLLDAAAYQAAIDA